MFLIDALVVVELLRVMSESTVVLSSVGKNYL